MTIQTDCKTDQNKKTETPELRITCKRVVTTRQGKFYEVLFYYGRIRHSAVVEIEDKAKYTQVDQARISSAIQAKMLSILGRTAKL